jgi:nucleoid DNA-binding protein
MNKKEFAQYIAENFECSSETAKAIIDIFTESINLAISEGREIALDNLGTFAVKYIPARETYNYKANKRVQILERITPYFKPSDNFKTVCAC